MYAFDLLLQVRGMAGASERYGRCKRAAWAVQRVNRAMSGAEQQPGKVRPGQTARGEVGEGKAEQRESAEGSTCERAAAPKNRERLAAVVVDGDPYSTDWSRLSSDCCLQSERESSGMAGELAGCGC